MTCSLESGIREQVEFGRWVGGVVSIGVTAAALAGCGGGHSRSGGTRATVPTGPTATTVDVAHVPATIDATYAQHVMDTLDQVLGDALRDFAANRGPTNRFNELLMAVYDKPQYDHEIADYGRLAAQFQSGAPPLWDRPGNPRTLVESLVDSSRTCIVANVERSF